ncbi:MAG: HAD-IB family hydrolase [Bacteroidota bacterium]
MTIQKNSNIRQTTDVIAFFDFDGTITTKDSLADFIQYAVGKAAYYMGLLLKSPVLAAYKLKFIPNHIAKEKLFSYFFKGWEVNEFQKIADKYSVEQIDKITRPKAMERIRWHKQQDHTVVIVTASMDCWLKEWCVKHNLDLIATRFEVRDGKITGKFATKNCYSAEKVKRIRDSYCLGDYSRIYAYGDSRGDKEMLTLADEKFYRFF